MWLHKFNSQPIRVVSRSLPTATKLTTSRTTVVTPSTTRTLLLRIRSQRQRSFSTTRAVMSGTIGVLAEAYSAAVSPATSSSSAPEGPKVWHRKGGGFRNPWPSWIDPQPAKLLSFILAQRIRRGQYFGPDTSEHTIKVLKPTFSNTRQTTELRATWLGHACYHVEFPGGLTALFDPVFSDRCSPVQFMGPKRFTEVPCQIGDIPIVDIVCISHNHYDHLDYHTIMKLKKQHPRAHYFVPMNLKAWFKSCGIENCTELDWWEEYDLTLVPDAAKESATELQSQITARISLLPCQHQGARGINDAGHCLWGSWTVESGGKKVYFAGDTGYRAVPKEAEDHGKDDYGEEYKDLPFCPVFKEIGEHRGPFDLGLIPIGAYNPRWIMSPMHVDPRDAVNIFLDIRCKKALGMHWGTFVLTEEPVMEPPQKLKAAMKEKGLPETGVFDVLDIGESRVF